MSIIETKNLSYIYGKSTKLGKVALNDINISIDEGQIIGIIGCTGSGKSTLVQHFNGLQKPTSGQVLIDGKDIWSDPKNIKDIRFKVGLVFQYSEYQLFEDVVWKDISFGLKNMRIGKDDIMRKVVMAANFVGLDSNLLNKSPFDLSGGEKRKAAIAGVIAMDPDILILDEPTAGLDPQSRDELISNISAYHSKRKNTVLIVSHSMEDIAKISDKVLVMNQGEVCMFEETKEIFSKAEQLEHLGLNVPQITKIMMKLKSKGHIVNTKILTVEQGTREILDILSGKGGKGDR